VSGGNQRIADGIAAELRGELRLRTVVVAVERDAQGVIVRSADGGAERGDAAVVAVPAPLVRRIRFSPPLPAATEDAYARVPMGVVSKLQVALDERMEPEAIQEVHAPFWAYTAVQDDGRSGVVASAAGGFGAQRALDVASGPGVWRERLGRTWPGLRLGDDGALLTCWGLDPWSRGSYTHRPVDWSDAAEAALRAPAGRVLFAGEHTADEQSIEGALLSGRRAAGEALRR
jgi:monoamine oxidase